MDTELISVVIPVFKVEKYLVRCVESVLNQSYRDIEVILVDDGSPDNCGAICEELARKDDRLRVYHKKNGGLSDARNYGTERAKGEYITFIDSDDYVAKDYLAYLYELAKKNDADISCCCMVKTESDHVLYGENPALPAQMILTSQEASYRLMSDLYMVLVTAWGKLYRMEIVKKYPFPVGKTHEDEATTCKYYFESRQVAIGNRCLYAYYQNPESITHTKTESLDSNKIWSLAHRAEFYEKQKTANLAQMAWDRYYSFLAKDAVYHKHRCRGLLLEMRDRTDISISPRLRTCLRLYCRAPGVFCCLYRLKRVYDTVFKSGFTIKSITG